MNTAKRTPNISKEMIVAAKTVFVCMAIVETIKPIVEGYQKKILNEEKYEYVEGLTDRHDKKATDWISSPNETYLMGGVSVPATGDFAHYMNRCREEQAKTGLITESPDHCPLLVAENNLVEAHHLLIDVMEPITKISNDDLWNTEHRKELIELTLKLLAPFVKA